MTLAYYSEFDPFAAQWLRNLIAAGHIAPGIVDERNLWDVHPNDLHGFTQVHLCAGIGVWSYALRRAGWRDDQPIWTASFPCQPFSAAGKGLGFADERHLWPAGLHLIRAVRPVRVLGEQVASKDGLAWLDLVQSDVEAAGYAFGAVDLCAAGVGAPHIRQRSFWVADAEHDDGRTDESGRGSDRRAVDGGGGEFVRLDDDDDARSQRHAGDGGATGGRQGSQRPASAPSISGGLGDTSSSGYKFGPRKLGVSAEQTDGQSLSEHCVAGDDSWPGPTNGFWRDADWLGCRDAKWRPVRPSHVKMVDGPTRSMGYGSGADSETYSTKEIDDPSLRILPETFGSETLVDRVPRGLRVLPETEILRQSLHGGGIRGDDQSPERQEQPPPIGQDAPAGLREVRQEGPPRTSSGREPAEQRSEQFADVVCLVPPSIARAEAEGDRRTLEYLLALRKTVLSAAALSEASGSIKEAWESLGQEVQNEIRLDFEDSSILIVRPFPLATGAINRVGRLRGFGNAIVAPVAQTFIETVMEILKEEGT